MVNATIIEKEMGAMANGEGIRIGWGALITVLVVALSGVIGYNYSNDVETQREVKILFSQKLDRNEYYQNHKDLENELRQIAREMQASVEKMTEVHSKQMGQLQSMFMEHLKEDRITFKDKLKRVLP